jgi:hypothetical protein
LSKVILEKLTIPQLVKRSAFYGARNFITVLTKAHDILSHRKLVHIRREEMNKRGEEQKRKQER